MTTILLTISLVVVFLIGIISPRLAGKIQRKTDKSAGLLKDISDWFWEPITWWCKLTIEFTRKAIKKVAEWGKKIRRKS